MKKRKKIGGDEEEENEEDEDENEEEESDEEGEEDEEKEGSESESEEGGKKGKKKSKSKKKDKSKGKAKDKGKKLNKSVVLKNKKKLDTTKGKMKQNRSVILKKKNLLDKIKNKNKKPINQIKKPKRSQSVTTTKKPKNQKLMMRTNRSAIIKGKKSGLHKNTFTNNNTKYNRTTRSEQKFYKKRNKIDISKKRSKTPIVSRFRNKFIGNKLKNNKFSKTDINIRTIPNKKNKNYSTQGTFNTTSNNINKRRLLTVGNDNLKRKYNFPSLRRESDELGPIIDKRHKFMQNTQNFFIPQRKLNLLRRDLIDSKYQEREEGFFNRITLYPKNTEQDENNSLKGDNLNPYSTNWPSSFLKIGYSSGFYYDDYQDGVPILRLKKLRNKIYLPPIQNSRYSQMSDKFGGNTSVNFNYMSRQERINYILNTENNNKDNVFKSQDARRRLLDKFNIKGFDLPTITNKKDEEENEESDEEGEEEEDDEDEDKEEKEDDENEDQNSDEKNEEDEEESNSHPNEIE